MKNSQWYARHKHLRDLRDRLADEGFTVVDAWEGRHVRIRVARNGNEGTVTIGVTPGDKTNAVNNTMQKARRIDPR